MIATRISIILLFCAQLCSAQTFEIYHKSHSGAASAQSYEGRDRFGEISPPISRIERIENENDTATILYYGFGGKISEQYRVVHHPIFNNPRIDMDSVMQTYPPEVQFIGFDHHSTEKKKEKRNGLFLLPFFQGPGSLLFLFLLFGLNEMFRYSRKNLRLAQA